MVTRPPPTIIEPQRNPSPGRLRSRSQQWLDTLIHKASLPSSRHSRSAENVKDVIANLGLAAGTVVTGHIKPKRPSEEDVLEGLGVLLNGFLNITQRVKAGLGNVVETIEVQYRIDPNNPELTVCRSGMMPSLCTVSIPLPRPNGTLLKFPQTRTQILRRRSVNKISRTAHRPGEREGCQSPWRLHLSVKKVLENS